MPTYEITAPDGKTYEVTAPDGATQEQVLAYAQQQFGGKRTHDGLPARQNADGSHSTELSITVTDPRLNGGKPTNIPSLWGGKELDEESAIRAALQSGRAFPGFDNINSAVAAAKARSNAGGAAAQQPAAGADDPGALMSALIGAGRTTDQIIDGMKQLGFNLTGNREALDALAADQAEKSRLYQPLRDQHPIMTAIGEAAPAMVVPVGGGATMAANAARLAAAGAIPGALEYGSAGDRAGRATAGATGALVGGIALPAAGRAIAKTVPAIGRTAKALVEPLTEGGRTAIAGRTLNRAAGDSADDVARALAQARPVVPGSMPTAAQVADNGGIAALERAVSQANPADFAQRGMEQAAARAAAVGDIAGDVGKRELFTAARNKTAQELYERAYSVPIELENLSPAMRGEVNKLMQMPAVQAGLKAARQNASNYGMKLDGEGSIAGLHHAKLAMDDMISELSGATGAQANKARAIQAARDRLVTFMEKMSPDYGEARATYAAMSKPINQMDVGQHLMDKMRPAITDHGGLARENANAFAQALRNGDAMVKQATGRPMKMADVMDPAQMETLGAVARDLARKANAQDLGRGAGSDTFQKLAMSNIAERSGAPRVVGGALSLPGVSKVAKFMYQEPEEQIQSIIARALLDPQSAATLMTSRAARPMPPISMWKTLAANPARATQLLGGGGGLATVNLFAE